ncbi:hypothetical protein [Sphingobacterium siyangense]|uniref:hypothetical protein n=1 Tax=Sphingobacterium siyangense TaxID=459529 RepID=UPI002FDDDA37
MNKIKTAIAALLIAGGTIGAFAFTKLDYKTTVAQTYWVTSLSGSNYTVSTSLPEDNQCGEGSDQPCQITTTQPLSAGNQISVADVMDTSKTSIDSRQPDFSH